MKSATPEVGKGSRRESPSGWPRSLPAVMIVAVTFVAYAAALSLGFVFDDHVLIVTNDSIRSWTYFPSYFTSHIWSFRYPHLLANYYRPLFLTWLRLNDVLFGLRPWGWHLSSVLAHCAVTWLVYRLSRRLIARRWAAVMAGLIFGLHPVHAEAVADITSIQEPLSTLFILAAMLAFIRAGRGFPAQARSWLGWPAHNAWLPLSILLTAAAMLSKESGMVVPILVGVYAWIYGGVDQYGRASATFGSDQSGIPGDLGRDAYTSLRQSPSPFSPAGTLNGLRLAIAASIPYCAVVLLYVPLRIRALKGFAHVVTPVRMPTEIFTIPSVLLFYLRLLLWPSRLSCYYDTPYVFIPTWHNFFLPVLLLSALAAVMASWYGRVRRSKPDDARAIDFSTLWVAVTLLPVLNFRFLPEGEIAHDRYLYLPSVGFAILAALALRTAICLATGRTAHPAIAVPDSANDPACNEPALELPVKRAIPLCVAWTMGIALFAAMGYATARQTLYWSDDLTLNYRAHEIAPHNVNATASLAAAVAQRGMDATAIALYRQALAVQPSFWRANVNLAYLEYALGNFPEAARLFARACAADATDGDQFLYLGMSLLRIGRPSDAEQAVRTALVVRPQGKSYHLGLAIVLRGEGKISEARQEVEAELALEPQNAQAKALLGELGP